MTTLLASKRREKFEAIQKFLVPRTKRFSREQFDESARIINDFIAERPKLITYKLIAFFIFIDLVSILLHFSIFSRLNEKNKNRVMEFFFDSPLGLFRKGFWGLNTLAKMGAYSQRSVYADIGYQLGEIRGQDQQRA